jgi:hypothetical protein
MKNIAIRIIIIFSVFFAVATVVSAQVSSVYYMKTVSTRHELNPAFQPLPNGYFYLPSPFYISVGNNSLTLSDVVYPKNINGVMKTVSFLHPEGGDKDKFYNQLRKNTVIFTDFQIDIVGFGFRFKEKNYFTFGIAEKGNYFQTIPKDLFKLALYGTPNVK